MGVCVYGEGCGVFDDACVYEWMCVYTFTLHVIIETEALLFNACARNK